MNEGKHMERLADLSGQATKLKSLIKKRMDDINEEFARLLQEDGSVDYYNYTLNDMTPEMWRTMTVYQRRIWKKYWGVRGIMSFCCIQCGFPTAYGTAGCDACRPLRENNDE